MKLQRSIIIRSLKSESAECPCDKQANNKTQTIKTKPLVQQRENNRRGKSDKRLGFNSKVLIGCEEHIQLQQQSPQEMISVKTVPTTIKLC